MTVADPQPHGPAIAEKDNESARLCGLCGAAFHLGSRCSVSIPETTRNNTLFRVAVRLIRWGGRWFTPERVEVYLLTENERRCVPPLPEAEVRQIAASANRTVRPTLRRRDAWPE